MNKKLLTLAVGAALAAGMSVAQAEVAVYGKLHASIDYQDNDAGNEETFISDNSSRFGIRVSEDLGAGLKGLGQWEISARVDENTIGSGTTDVGLNANRNSFLGLGGGFGTVRVGRYDTPFKDLGRKTDLFNERVGDSRNVIGGAAIPATVGGVAVDPSSGFDARVTNMVRYDSPDFGGINAAVLYSTDEEGAADTYRSASVSYQGGPLFAGVAYEEHSLAPGAVISTENETGIRLGVGFKSGAFTLNAMYETLEDIAGISGSDQDTYGVGAAFKFGSATAKAQYFTAEDAADLMAVGLDYSFSKTVTAYVAYAQVDNEPLGDANVASSNGGHGDVLTAAAGTSPSAFSVGMEMNF